MSDPVGSGFAASIPRPLGNATGFTTFEPAMAGKWLALLKEIAPRISRAGLLFHSAAAPSVGSFLASFRAAAIPLAITTVAAPVRDESDLETVVAAQARDPNGGLVAMPDTFIFAHHAQVGALAARYRLPSVTPWRVNTEGSGLLSYGLDLSDNFRRAATYVDRILKGTKPSELPVQAPVKFELVVNMKTAKLLGLTVPDKLLVAADEVIE